MSPRYYDDGLDEIRKQFSEVRDLPAGLTDQEFYSHPVVVHAAELAEEVVRHDSDVRNRLDSVPLDSLPKIKRSLLQDYRRQRNSEETDDTTLAKVETAVAIRALGGAR